MIFGVTCWSATFVHFYPAIDVLWLIKKGSVEFPNQFLFSLRVRNSTVREIAIRQRDYILGSLLVTMDSKPISIILFVIGLLFIIVGGTIPYVGGSVSLIGTASLAAGLVGLAFYCKW